MKLRLFTAAALAVALLSSAACTTTGAPTSPPISGEATVLDEKALYAAEAAYNVAANAYLVADGKGLISADLKAKVKPIMMDAYVSLTLARQAYAAGNASSLTAQAALVVDLAAKARRLLPSS